MIRLYHTAVAVLLLLACASGAIPPKASSLGDTSAGDLLRQRLHSGAMGPEDLVFPVDAEEANLACQECELAVVVLQEELELGASYDFLVLEAIVICKNFTSYTDTYCEGYVPLVAPIFYHILTTNDVDPLDFCGILMSSYGCNTTNPARDWSVEIHGDKPPLEPIILPDPGQPTLKILHLADTHLDPLYLPGSNAACDNELCCREESGPPESPEAEAWFWGDYRKCGSPRWMLEDMMANIGSEHPDIDYIYWTGDVVPHNMWSTSRETNLQILKETNEMIQAFFPDIPVFPVAGNHEANPLDQFPNPEDCPEELTNDWLYGEMAAHWSRVVPGLDNTTVLYGGFYSVLLQPGFRIISVNSMFGYSSNVWLAENSTDLASELAWLETELWQAEAAGELVHLLGHIPPGIIKAERTWSREYNRIIRRYESTIRGQFFGHTHTDEFEVFLEDGRPVGVAYIAPSQTPWYNYNPSYRIYIVDGDRTDTTRLVLGHSTYIMNLTEAHETNISRWYELYSARDEYGMASLMPSDWEDLTFRMAENRTLFDIYWRNYANAADPYLAEGCDDVCYEQRLCDLVTSDRNDLDACYGVIERKRKVYHLSEN